MLVVFVLLFSACSTDSTEETATTPIAVQETETPTVGSDVVATVDGVPVYIDDYDDAYAYYQSYYSYYYGDDLSTYESEIIDTAMSAVVDEQIYLNNLGELGYLDYTDENLTDAEAKAQEDIEYYADINYGEEIVESLGSDYTPEEYTEALAGYEEKVLSEIFEMTRDEVVEYYLVSDAKDRAYADILEAVSPAQEAVEEYYVDVLAEYKASVLEDPSAYISDVSNGYTTYYIPKGVRMVKQILVTLDEDTAGAISVLRSNGYDDAADLLLEKGLADIKEEAESILSQLNKGKITFEEAIEKYNDDTGLPENGYPVIADNDVYVESFTDAAMAIEKPGDITTGLVESDYGYHIIEYYGDVEEGEMSLEDVYDEIFSELADSLGSEAWDETVAKWQEDADIVYYYENI